MMSMMSGRGVVRRGRPTLQGGRAIVCQARVLLSEPATQSRQTRGIHEPEEGGAPDASACPYGKTRMGIGAVALLASLDCGASASEEAPAHPRAPRAIRGWPRAPPSRTMLDMCIICADFDRGALKVDEARRALREMISTLDAGHARQVAEKLDEAAQEGHEPPSTT